MARSFNGTTDLITMDGAASYSLQVAYSFSMWVNAGAASGRPFSEGRSTSNNPFLQFECSVSAKAQVVTRGDGGGGNALNTISTATVFDSTWHHVVYAQDASGNFTLYVDGTLDQSGAFTTAATTINRCTVGCARLASNSNFYTGKAAEVAKWSRMLSAGEAASLGAGLPASHLQPTHYWPLWGADSPEPDLGNSAHTAGTLTGTASTNGGRVNADLLTI